MQDAKLELLMIIGEENAERYAFYYKIKVAGIFSWYEERMSIEEAQKEIESKEGDFVLIYKNIFL